MKQHKSGGGFTLIEFMVYIAVLAILGGAISMLFLWTLKVHTKAQVLQETVASGEVALERVMSEVREAESLYLSTATSSQISLETKTSFPSGETTGFLDFFLCGEALCMKKEGEDPSALTPDTVEVTNLSFTPISTNTLFPSLRMSITLEHKNPNTRPELEAAVELTSTASLR
ncbi:MAG: type II secretion system protein [Candidatus Yanofskybacteria bacterium]|nr:type II secretion system protein [Candidatus Yanofskybacteria bacterium]